MGYAALIAILRLSPLASVTEFHLRADLGKQAQCGDRKRVIFLLAQTNNSARARSAGSLEHPAAAASPPDRLSAGGHRRGVGRTIGLADSIRDAFDLQLFDFILLK